MLAAPFIPTTAAKLFVAMNTLDTSWPEDVATALASLEAGHSFSVPDNLFAKITDEEREDWAARFSGIRS